MTQKLNLSVNSKKKYAKTTLHTQNIGKPPTPNIDATERETQYKTATPKHVKPIGRCS